MWGSWNQLSFWWVKIHRQIFYCMGVRALNPCIFQGSTVSKTNELSVVKLKTVGLYWAMWKTALILDFALIVAKSFKNGRVLIGLDSQHISVIKCKQNIRKRVRLTSCPLMPARPGFPVSPCSPYKDTIYTMKNVIYKNFY